MTRSPWFRTAMTLLGCFAAWGCSSKDGGEPSVSGGSGGAPSACPAGQLLCGGRCTSLASDVQNCGACGQACVPGQTCVGGSCTCTPPLTACAGICVDTSRDAGHCGVCGASCPLGAACQAGACQCQEGLVDCGGACVNPQGDGNNCGACGAACPPGQVCSAGVCGTTCTVPGESPCGTSCVDLNTSISHCGACGTACASGQTCHAGQCGCGGLLECGGQCFDGSIDAFHCGTCDTVCDGARSCIAGRCECPAGTELCAAQCTDTDTHASHCGACNVACGPGQSCETGVCVGGGSGGGPGTGGSGAAGSGGAPMGGASGTGGGGAGAGGTTAGSGGAGDCVDEPPPNGDNCQHAVEWGWCDDAWMNGACALSCGRCSGGTGGTGTGGGSGSGGAATGGVGTGGAGSGGVGTGGVGTGGVGTGGNPGRVFPQCRFHFGTIDSFARENAGIRAEIDYFTPGWMGLSNTFDQEYVCEEANGTLAGKVPVIVAYVAAFYAKREGGLNDCNVGNPDLCTYGASIIKQDLSSILNVYRSYAQGYANCYGTSKPIIFEMEPDYYQYTNDSQTDRMTPAEAGQIMSQFVAAIRQHLPNAVFSMDISPWVAPNNGRDNGASWYANFDMSLFTFINTSGGGTSAGTTRIRSSNEMTWAGVSQVTGKPILADTGYGVNGSSAGHDAAWDNVTNINDRIRDGVVGIAQYNPNSSWGTTLSQIRGQLATPTRCP